VLSAILWYRTPRRETLFGLQVVPHQNTFYPARYALFDCWVSGLGGAGVLRGALQGLSVVIVSRVQGMGSGLC